MSRAEGDLPRVASRIAGIELSLIRQLHMAAAPGCINLGLGEPTLPTPAAVCDAAARHLSGRAVRYTHVAGDPGLRARIADRVGLAEGGPDSVIVTCGSQQALALALLGLLDPEDEILVPEVAYPGYAMVARTAQARVVCYPTPAERSFHPLAEEIEARVGPRSRIVVVCSPGNPTGMVVAGSEVEALERLARERSLWILSDEIYHEVHLGPLPPRQPRGPQTLVVGGPAKSHAMTGFRVGWLVGPTSLVTRILPLHQQMVLCASSVAQAAAMAALDLSDGGEYGDEVRLAYRQRMDVLRGALSGTSLRLHEPEGGFYLFADARARIGESSRQFAFEAARRGGVIVVPGEAFSPEARGFLRISFVGAEAELVEGARRLASALAAWAGP